ncbi:flagellar basal body-associated protein FliL [Rubellimicrobium rubrum]|uniref:Flagellar protein FliL n=1 Tax=Rubellimicrobium rubrum TaxID=2585369 RepID=A0A5C4N5E1_9RHOB|nr:flagellar basal body-associated FliL family protein [Rubellimicrobium rubrum]TNC51568.1 flagellar basal body-associated protein FliL [Rubellimicrobium rubrum]
MKRLLIPLILLFLGLGGGVGAGLLLTPAHEESDTEEQAAAELANPCGEVVPASEAEEHATGSETDAEHGTEEAAEDGHAEETQEVMSEDGHPLHDYVKLNNQFIVPLLTDGQVDALVQLSLSVEVPAGQQETILMMEPKLRDSFLQVLFDHANTGGFDGLFTASSAMRELRNALLEAAQDAAGGVVTDILILDLVRQSK